MAAKELTMQPFIYLQTQKWNPISMAIRFATRSDWSHAGFVCGNRFFSAQGDGVRWRDCDPHAKLLFLTAPKIEEAFNWATTQLGKPYDFTALFGLALDRNWREDDSWFCSELVAAAFEAVGAPLFNLSTPVYRITPRDILLSPYVQVVTPVAYEMSHEERMSRST